MSAISNRHQLVKLDKSSKAFTGQRLVRVIAKAAKESLGEGWIKKESGFYSPHLTESVCVSVPFVQLDDIEANIASLLPHIGVMIQNVQDSIIADMRKESGIDTIGDDDISVAKCISWLEAESKGNRISGEYLAKWFEDTYSIQAAEYISIAFKFPPDFELLTPDQAKVVETKVNVLRDMFTGYASGKYKPEIPKCKAMIKFCEFVGAEGMDSRMVGYQEKTVKVLAEKEAELSVNALGF